MRYSFIISFAFSSFSLVAQDSISTSSSPFAEIRKQRFIDRYENVFMTKVPTRHMIKLGVEPVAGWLGQTQYTNSISFSSLAVGYEFKITPAISIGIDAATVMSLPDLGEGGSLAGRTNISPKIRWYYDLSRRIKEGESANNFSGNYLGLATNYSISHDRHGSSVFPQAGLEWGFQRRFFNRGFADFGIGLYYNFDSRFKYNGYADFEALSSMEGYRLGLGTRATLGLAFGDWKKKDNLPECEVLRCDELVKNQLTVSWPRINLGLRYQNLGLGVGFEQKIVPSLSVKIQSDGLLVSFLKSDFSQIGSRQIEWSSDVQLRYYFLQQRDRNRGQGGNGLSGFYVAGLTRYVVFDQVLQLTGETGQPLKIGQQFKALNLGLAIGYQKTLFRHAYLDVSLDISKELTRSGTVFPANWSVMKVGFGLRF